MFSRSTFILHVSLLHMLTPFIWDPSSLTVVFQRLRLFHTPVPGTPPEESADKLPRSHARLRLVVGGKPPPRLTANLSFLKALPSHVALLRKPPSVAPSEASLASQQAGLWGSASLTTSGVGLLLCRLSSDLPRFILHLVSPAQSPSRYARALVSHLGSFLTSVRHK